MNKENKKLKEGTFTWIRDVHIQNFNGADNKGARPIFLSVATEHYVIGHKLYSKLSRIKPPRIELPFQLTKNKTSYIDLNEAFILEKEIDHKQVLQAKEDWLEYIYDEIQELDYAKKSFDGAKEKMIKMEEELEIEEAFELDDEDENAEKKKKKNQENAIMM